MSLIVENLYFHFGNKKILDNISFKAKKGEIIAILGLNGAGKTTLLKCLCGLLTPTFGKIEFDDQPLHELPLKTISKIVSYFAQSHITNNLSVFESILLSRKPYVGYGFSLKDYAKTQNIIKKLNLEQFAFKQISQLSGGEVQKVRIAQLLSQRSKLFLIDEPLNNLDIRNQIEIMRIIKNLTIENNLIVIMSLHDVNIAINYADSLIFLKNGEVLDFCSPKQVDANIVQETYNVKLNVFTQNGQKIYLPLF